MKSANIQPTTSNVKAFVSFISGMKFETHH